MAASDGVPIPTASTVTASVPREELVRELRRLEQNRCVLGERLQRILTALALTLDAQRAMRERIAVLDADGRALEPDLAPLELSAARYREIVRSLRLR